MQCSVIIPTLSCKKKHRVDLERWKQRKQKRRGVYVTPLSKAFVFKSHKAKVTKYHLVMITPAVTPVNMLKFKPWILWTHYDIIAGSLVVTCICLYTFYIAKVTHIDSHDTSHTLLQKIQSLKGSSSAIVIQDENFKKKTWRMFTVYFFLLWIFLSQSRPSETKNATLEEDTQATIAYVIVHAPTQVILHIIFV